MATFLAALGCERPVGRYCGYCAEVGCRSNTANGPTNWTWYSPKPAGNRASPNGHLPGPRVS